MTSTTNTTSGGTPSDLLAALQSAWGRVNVDLPPIATHSTNEPHRPQKIAQAAPQTATVADKAPRPTATRICPVHLQPFDTVERPAPRRAGWVRFTCRRCGRFLGYSPVDGSRTLNDHG